MKKFYVMASMLGLGMLGLAGVTPTLVSASDVTSNGQVKFKLDQSQTDPKNPLDPADKNPGKPTDPTQPGGKVPGGTGGPLSIDFASSLIFGEAEISHEDATYYAKPQTFTQDDGTTVDRPNFIQVTDKRGTFEGWTLKVKQENQFAVKDDPTKELTGAQLSFTMVTWFQAPMHNMHRSSRSHLISFRARHKLLRLKRLLIKGWAPGSTGSAMIRRWPSQLRCQCQARPRKWLKPTRLL